MRTNRILQLAKALSLLLAIISYSCCKSSDESNPFVAAGFDPFDQDLGKRIVAYQVKASNSQVKEERPALYIDFSSGINKAFASPDISAMMNYCFNTVLADQFDVYKLGANQITQLQVSNTTQLGQQVNDPNQYADIWAPIQKAVEKIVSESRDALLITDFEEWQGNVEVTNTAYLKIPFSKWLAKGNAIHFFVADYKEGQIAKHLYFTVFSHGAPNASSMISKLENKMASSTTRFDLSNNTYQLHTNYPGQKTGGIFYDASAKSQKEKNVLDLKATYINGLTDGSPFEYYPLGIDWENIAKLHSAYQDEHQFNDFFRGLFIDLSNNDSYKLTEFETKVYDITADFKKFAEQEEAKKHKPKLAKGSNGETKLADSEKNPIALACYNTNGEIKEEYIYKSQPVNAIPEVFTLNKALFDNTKASDPKNTELGTAFDPKFNIKNIQEPKGLIKVDLVVKTATPNLDNSKLELFKWTNAKGTHNTALYDSIKHTLQEQQPNNKAIYSYYIKTIAN